MAGVGSRTPIGPGEHAELLRALGRFFETEDARQIEIVNHGEFVSISWLTQDPYGGEMNYREHELTELRKRAREARSGVQYDPLGGKWAEILRTLGQDLDQESADLASILGQRAGFVVACQIGGRYAQRRYRMNDLLESSRIRRALRRGAKPFASPKPQPPEPMAAPARPPKGPLERRLRPF